MAIRGRPEILGYSKDQTGQILLSPEPAGSAGTMAYRGAPGEYGAALYRLGTQDRVKSLVC
jgi:hypothetical protein